MRREKTFIRIIVVVALLGVFIFFATTNMMAGVRDGVVRILRPLFGATSAVQRSVQEFGSDENAKQDVEQARFEITLLQDENESLRSALSFRDTYGVPLIGAGVVSYFNEFGKEFLLIDQGTDVGIKVGDFAITARNLLVGRVTDVGNGFSHIALASNGDSVFETDLIPLYQPVLSRGIGARSFSVELLPADVEVRAGDFIAVRAFAGDVRRSYLLAIITAAGGDQGGAFKSVRATLLARPERLQEVFIVFSPE